MWLFKRKALESSPVTNSAAKFCPAFLNQPWQKKSIRAWTALVIGKSQHGKRQFCRIIIDWNLRDGTLHYDMKFDRKMKFKILRDGIGIFKIYDKLHGGKVLMTVRLNSYPYKGDTVQLS